MTLNIHAPASAPESAAVAPPRAVGAGTAAPGFGAEAVSVTLSSLAAVADGRVDPGDPGVRAVGALEAARKATRQAALGLAAERVRQLVVQLKALLSLGQARPAELGRLARSLAAAARALVDAARQAGADADPGATADAVAGGSSESLAATLVAAQDAIAEARARLDRRASRHRADAAERLDLDQAADAVGGLMQAVHDQGLGGLMVPAGGAFDLSA